MSRSDRPPYSAKLFAMLEITSYLFFTSLLVLFYTFRWLDIEHLGVAVLVQLLLLAALAWATLGEGRHPCFIFLCLLPLFQTGKLIASMMTSSIDPYQIVFLTPQPFTVSHDAQGTFLFALSLSAICIYAPCRWNYRFIATEEIPESSRRIAYLYAVFYGTLPFVILENSIYLHYANAHGGYLTLFVQRADLVASVPMPIRAISVFLTPAFLALFVLETRKARLYFTTTLYFLATSIFLLIGSRSGILTTILALWCVSRLKTPMTRSNLRAATITGTLLLLFAGALGTFRSNSDKEDSAFSVSTFIAGQGTTMDVSQIAIQYRDRFSPYVFPYLLGEIGNAFMLRDQSNYSRGASFGDDVTVFLNPDAYDIGAGLGSSYLAEAYVAGAIPGVIVVSLLLGFALNGLYLSCSTRFGLLVSAVMLPSIFWMVRSGIFDWSSTLVRDSLLFLLLLIGWKIYSLFVQAFRGKLKANSRSSREPLGAGVRD